MAAALIDRETLDADAVGELLADVPKWRRSRDLQQVEPPDLVEVEELAV
jgi:hypothetical protein